MSLSNHGGSQHGEFEDLKGNVLCDGLDKKQRSTQDLFCILNISSDLNYGNLHYCYLNKLLVLNANEMGPMIGHLNAFLPPGRGEFENKQSFNILLKGAEVKASLGLVHKSDPRC